MLRIEDLSAGILQQLDFSVAKADCVAVVGESGSGKTTLLNAIAGYITYQGQITLGQTCLDSLPPWQRPCRYLNQRLYLFPHKTVAGNLALVQDKKLSAAEKRLQQTDWLKKLKIAHLANRYPSQLSGGEQQRAALARVLINLPQLLLLDEPFSSLDWDTRQHIWAILKPLIEEYSLTTLFVTHEPREVDYLANRQIQLEKGKIKIR